MPQINLALIVSNQAEDRQLVIVSALRCGLSPIHCATLQEAKILLSQEDFRIVICDESLVDGDFRAVLREVKRTQPHTPVIVFGHAFDWDLYLKALSTGIFDYISSPPNPVEAERIIWSALLDTGGMKNGQAEA